MCKRVGTHPPWYNNRLCKLKNAKSAAHKQFKSNNSPADYQIFSRLRKEFIFLSKFLASKYLHSLESNIKANPKHFWTFFNSKRKSVGFPSVMHFSGETSSNPEKVVDMFANFFQNIYNSSNSVNLDDAYFDSLQSFANASSLVFEREEIYDALANLDANTKVDTLGFYPIVLKHCARSLCTPLQIIFNQSLACGVFLEDWKYSCISPVFKNGKKDHVCNYRPISKLPAVPKLLDNLVNKRLQGILKGHISDCQHGFWKGRSTCSNLVEFTNFCSRAMESRYEVHVVYTDFVKAFSRVNLNILSRKLKAFGFYGSLLEWLISYLTGRKQRVAIGKYFSKEIFVTSGVPEGSHLGPSLFLLFVNDLPSILKFCRCLLYADDVKFFSCITSINDCNRFQLDLNRFSEWCRFNDLIVNIEKCTSMSFSRLLLNIQPSYLIDNKLLKIVNDFKDLGVIFDSKLNFDLHIEYLTSKASCLLGFLKRNSTDFKDPYTLKAIYSSIVRPILEYCSVVWNPIALKNINRIERVQKNFLRFALRRFFHDATIRVSYKSKCLLLGMQSLELRRKMFGIMFIRDLLCSSLDCENLLRHINIYAPQRALRARPLLFDDRHHTLYGTREPISLCSNFFNSVYDNLDISMPRNTFKSYLMLILSQN